MTTRKFNIYKAQKHWMLFLLLVLSGQQLLAQSAGYNYIRVRKPNRAFNSSARLDLLTTNKDSVQTVIQYVDGIGRLLQTVQVKGSPQGNDIVQPHAFDQNGRESVKYLPYSVTAASPGSYESTALNGSSGYSNSQQNAFYSTSIPTGVSGIATPFSVTIFENSPLNRPLEQGAPGNDWQPVANSTAGHTVKLIYTANNTIALTDTAHTMIAAFYTATINPNQSRTLSRASGTAGNYAAGALYVTILKDENWKSGRGGTTEEYKDKEDHVVLKRAYNYTGGTLQILSTYYVYDDMGNLAFVLPPASGADNTKPSQVQLDNLCYQYRYDERQRPTQKKIPGKGWEFRVYNKLDRPVLSQDSVQRVSNQWTVIKYDALGRVIMTGLWNAGSVISLATLKSSIYAGAQWDIRNYADNITGYSISSYPAMSKTLVVNYYDDYTNIPNLPAGYNVVSPRSYMTGNLPTVSKTTVLNTINNTTPDMLWSLNYYDDFGRILRTYKQNYLGGTANVANFDVVINTYNFNSQVTTANRRHFTSAAAGVPRLTIVNQYIYDHVGRKLKTWEQLTNNTLAADTRTLLSKIDYNEIGQVWKKNLHSTDSVSYKLTETYSYNERGWLLGKSSDQFGLALLYNGGLTPQYNGNISGQSWIAAGSTGKNYSYSYDQLNRLVAGNASDGNAENAITYDPMGGISSLNRYANNTLIDNLTYTYPTNSVQLQSVNDATANDAGLIHGTTSYTYDGNGNLTGDSGKGITISYNMLNLPQSIPAKSTTYTYDAGGEKLARLVGTAQTDYVSGIQYDGSTASSTISFIQTAEGKAIPSGPITYNYEYNLTDHQGNSRVSFDTGTGGPRQVQTDDYYPFGLEIGRTVTGTKNEYLYNKKELQENVGLYDYGARLYDPVVARWGSIDRLAELHQDFTPYNYVLNNSVNYIDPIGLDTVSVNAPPGSVNPNDQVNLGNGTSPTMLIGDVVITPDGGYNQGSLSGLWNWRLGNNVIPYQWRHFANQAGINWSIFGKTETAQNGVEAKISDANILGKFGFLADKFRFAAFQFKSDGEAKLLNVNATAFVNQFGEITRSSNISLNGGPVAVKLTSSIGVEVEIGVDGLFGVRGGISLDDGFLIGGSVGKYGFETSARPGIGVAAAVAVAASSGAVLALF